MDANITKALNDKLYDKRKSGALELEGLIRDALAAQDHDRIAKIVHQLCHEYAYAVHQPHARNGGLIGLAAASIALGPVRIQARQDRMDVKADVHTGSSSVS
jgi:vacuole morphology and inheritance protein 14